MQLAIDRATTVASAADATLVVGMQRGLVIDRDLIAGFNIAQSNEENVVVKNLHERIRTARMIDVVSAVAAAAAVEAPAIIDLTNPEHAPMSAASRFRVGDLLAGVLGNLVSLLEGDGGKAAFAVDC